MKSNISPFRTLSVQTRPHAPSEKAASSDVDSVNDWRPRRHRRLSQPELPADWDHAGLEHGLPLLLPPPPEHMLLLVIEKDVSAKRL
jgi:hypothetical protein